ncbi:MAG: endolytic transglycosylase MltG [Rhodospirillales bacterium]|nr:endolytic transglycosylase MltG [Rhodospirillales bacterium]MBO6786245.1 endolytic transglycosylase MltG [Rhodospirillales bacterium]
MRRLFIFIVVLILLAGAVAGAGFFWLQTAYTASSHTDTDKIIVIERGSSVASIARQLQEEGLIQYARVFRLGIRLIADRRPLQAGEYRIPAQASAAEIASILKSGEQVVHKTTLAEGLSSIQIVDLLRDEPLLAGKIETVPPEGTLLPETYHFHRGETRTEILRRMRTALDDVLSELWATRAADLPFSTREEAMILASIVEKETAVEAERELVAGVFVNRMKKGMRLQSDPTVVYGITRGAGPLGRPLSRGDLDAETAYNTYRIDGLPPTPIANPGRASIAAVLNPAKTDALYFVADGSGGHAFAKTLDEHNRNVRAWRKIQRDN